MPPPSGHAPPWLFSFVDLAFLLLIAMTQIAGAADRKPDLGEFKVPRIHEDSTAQLPDGARERWQLRVHPPAGGIGTLSGPSTGHALGRTDPARGPVPRPAGKESGEFEPARVHDGAPSP